MLRALSLLSLLGLFLSASALADEPCPTPVQAPIAAPVVPVASSASSPTRLRELGAKAYVGRDPNGDPTGGSFYLRAHRSGARWGLELSSDFIAGFPFKQAAAVRYFQEHNRLRPYAVGGFGAPFTLIEYAIDGPWYTGQSAQLGGGVDVRLSPRWSLNVDTRLMFADVTTHSFWVLPSAPTTPSQTSFGVMLGSIGLSYQFESPIARVAKATSKAYQTYAPQLRSHW